MQVTALTSCSDMFMLFSQGQGFVTVDEAERQLSWSTGRATDALETLLEVSLFAANFSIQTLKNK